MTKIICNAKIYLQHRISGEASEVKFAEALIINDGKILKTGSSKDILETAPLKAEKIDAQGALILPAFYDSHLHLMWAGRREAGIEFAGAKSIEEIIRRGRDTIARLKPTAGACVQGSGVNPDCFCEGEKRDLNRYDLDKISEDRPLVFNRHCGHTIYCNSLALEIAGLSESAPDIEGGVIEKDKNGRPTGVLRENASSLVKKTAAVSSAEEMTDHLRFGMEKAHSLGITSCGSYDSDGTNFNDVLAAYNRLYDEYREKNLPGLRVNMQCGISTREDQLDALLSRKKTNGFILREDSRWGALLKIQALKLFADGTLGGHTAWMRKPYCDKPQTSGFPLINQDRLNRFVKKSSDAGLQVLIHAIGDAGIDAVLQAFENVTTPGGNPLRHGIIHCQITSPDLLERMARNKILAIVQPAFLADDIHILESRVGSELAASSYAWGSMKRLGIPVSYSTDAPVSPLDPINNIEWAVLRGSAASQAAKSINENEKVDIFRAVDAVTISSAFSGFDEKLLGNIEPGKLADLVFLDRDIFSIPPEEIHKTKVLRTMCAGETVYSSQ